MKSYIVHFRTYSVTGNILRDNQAVLVKVNTTTPFSGLFQRYIDRELDGEKSLVTSIVDVTTDAIAQRQIKELSKFMVVKTVLSIKFTDPKKPETLIIEAETI